jgi:hypothetical protein
MYNAEYCPWCGRSINKKNKIIKVIKVHNRISYTWTAWTDKNEELFIKHTWGFISIFDTLSRSIIFSTRISESKDMNYLFNYETLKKCTAGVFEWPEECEDVRDK